MESGDSRMRWKISRYTHLIELETRGGRIYNGRTGAIVELSSGVYRKARLLLESRAPIDEPRAGSRARELFSHLIAGGFFVREELDELTILEHQYETERLRSQFLLTILPTFGCNLGCEYCFVGKKKGMMSQETQIHIVDFVSSYLKDHAVPSMSVDWFGGEPLLSLPVIQD